MVVVVVVHVNCSIDCCFVPCFAFLAFFMAEM